MLRTSSAAAAALLVLCAVDGPTTAAAAENAERERRVATMLASERPIAARPTPWIDEMTWMEVRDAIAVGTTTVIVPTGGIEENGPYVATGKHNVILQGTCPAIAEQLGNALCAPILRYAPPEGFNDEPRSALRIPGTINLSTDTYESMLDDIATSLANGGFRDVVFIGDSGGNQAPMAAVAERLNDRWADRPARAHFVRDYYDPGWVATEDYTAEVLGVAESGHDGHHDDIWVTAMMMVTDPDQVRFAERVEAGLASINGVPIVPLTETVELGRRMIEFRAALTADAIRAAVDGG